jgi:hypothetical protein
VITFGTSSAVAFFDDAKKLPSDRIWMWVAGSICVVFGVLILALKPDPEEDDSDGLFSSPEKSSLLNEEEVEACSPLAEETTRHWNDVALTWRDYIYSPHRACTAGEGEGNGMFSMECMNQDTRKAGNRVQTGEYNVSGSSSDHGEAQHSAL